MDKLTPQPLLNTEMTGTLKTSSVSQNKQDFTPATTDSNSKSLLLESKQRENTPQTV